MMASPVHVHWKKEPVNRFGQILGHCSCCAAPPEREVALEVAANPTKEDKKNEGEDRIEGTDTSAAAGGTSMGAALVVNQVKGTTALGKGKATGKATGKGKKGTGEDKNKNTLAGKTAKADDGAADKEQRPEGIELYDAKGHVVLNVVLKLEVDSETTATNTELTWFPCAAGTSARKHPSKHRQDRQDRQDHVGDGSAFAAGDNGDGNEAHRWRGGGFSPVRPSSAPPSSQMASNTMRPSPVKARSRRAANMANMAHGRRGRHGRYGHACGGGRPHSARADRRRRGGEGSPASSASTASPPSSPSLSSAFGQNDHNLVHGAARTWAPTVFDDGRIALGARLVIVPAKRRPREAATRKNSGGTTRPHSAHQNSGGSTHRLHHRNTPTRPHSAHQSGRAIRRGGSSGGGGGGGGVGVGGGGEESASPGAGTGTSAERQQGSAASADVGADASAGATKKKVKGGESSNRRRVRPKSATARSAGTSNHGNHRGGMMRDAPATVAVVRRRHSQTIALAAAVKKTPHFMRLRETDFERMNVVKSMARSRRITRAVDLNF